MTDHKKAFRAATLAVRIDPDNNLAAAYIELAVQLEAERKALKNEQARSRTLACPDERRYGNVHPAPAVAPSDEALRLEGLEEAAKIADEHYFSGNMPGLIRAEIDRRKANLDSAIDAKAEQKT